MINTLETLERRLTVVSAEKEKLEAAIAFLRANPDAADILEFLRHTP